MFRFSLQGSWGFAGAVDSSMVLGDNIRVAVFTNLVPRAFLSDDCFFFSFFFLVTPLDVNVWLCCAVHKRLMSGEYGLAAVQ